MRTMWYMGSKSRLVPGFIDSAIESVTPKHGCVLDIFGGAGSVSLNLVSRYSVAANDAQKYSRVTLGSLIEHGPRSAKTLAAELNFEKDLKPAYEAQFARLANDFAEPLKREANGLQQCLAGQFADYREFLATAPMFPESGSVHKLWSKSARYFDAAAVANTRRNIWRRQRNLNIPKSERLAHDYHLITTYYQNIYFGLRQSLELDALRFAIDQLEGRSKQRKKQHYLAALLYAASTSTSGTSHFAQPRSLKSDKDLKKVAERRSTSIVMQTAEQSEQLKAFIRKTNYRSGNKCYHGDYSRVLSFAGERCSTVYADPPYTADNYSRFYHVLEVLTRYDYPELQVNRGRLTKGRYPVTSYRFSSQFCRASQVEAAFHQFVESCANRNTNLVLSYAKPTGLLFKSWSKNMSMKRAEERFLELFKAQYHKVDIRQFSTLHSGQGDSHIPVTELLVVCDAPKRYVPQPIDATTETTKASAAEALACAI